MPSKSRPVRAMQRRPEVTHLDSREKQTAEVSLWLAISICSYAPPRPLPYYFAPDAPPSPDFVSVVMSGSDSPLPAVSSSESSPPLFSLPDTPALSCFHFIAIESSPRPLLSPSLSLIEFHLVSLLLHLDCSPSRCLRLLVFVDHLKASAFSQYPYCCLSIADSLFCGISRFPAARFGTHECPIEGHGDIENRMPRTFPSSRRPGIPVHVQLSLIRCESAR